MIRYIIRMPANLNPRLKVVVIDDKPENLLAFGAALKSLDCDLQKFSSGKEALVYLKSNEVALVLLDVQMPEMDGFEVAQRIRAEHGNAAPPIIFITALSPSPDFINKAYDCGAADFITKPVDSRILTAKVKVFLDLFVTRTKLAETILHAGEQKFRSLSESVPAIVFITDTRANTMYLNKYWYEYTGNTPGDLSLDAWIKAIHPDDLQKVNETWSAAEKSKTKWVCEYRLRRHDGVYHWHLGTSIPEKEIGNDFYWVGTVTDINDQKKIQTEVAESVKVLDQMFSESHSFMAILSYPELRFLKSNAKHKLLLRKNNFIGKTLLEVEPELESQGIVELLNEVASTGNPFVGTEVPIYYAATNSEPEKTSYLDFTYRPLEGADGKVYAILAQGYDVTEKVLSRIELERTKNAITNERENFRNLFRQTPEMVCVLSGPDHLFEFVNDAHIAALGFDATGKTVREAQPESVEVHGLLDDVYRTGKTALLHEIPVTLGNSVRHFNLTYAARKNEAGKTNGVMILGAEVTDVVQSRKLLAREAKLIESMPAPFFAVDADWKIIYWNPASVEVIGLKQEAVLDKVIWDVFPGLKESEFGETYIRSKNEQTIHNFEAFYSHYNRWYRVWSFPFEGGIAVTFLDVTDRKIIEEELEKSKERYRILFDHSPLPKWIIDVETLKFVDVNNAALQHYGYTKEEFLSLKGTEIRPPEDVEGFVETMKMDFTKENQDKINLRRRHMKKDGTIIEVEMSALDIVLDGRKCRIGAAVDITERVKADARQAELLAHVQAAKEEAERANDLKSAFLANMSHEIRTPLGAMVGFADLLRDPSLSREEHSNYIGILTRNGEQLSTIINDILDLSKVEAGHLTLEFEDTSADQVAADVVSLMRVKANEKDLALDFKAESSTPTTIVTDSLRVRQILMNIVGNAIKFTQAGSVKVRSFGTDAGPDGRMLYFEVKDTGIGIPESEKERIFEAFVQADGTLVRRFGGTGLGLALSRELARKLGGDVTVTKTAEGKGSTFLISIQDQPEKRTERSERQTESDFGEPAQNSLEGISVLVVDDSPDNRQLLWHFLTKFGAIVDFAENGLLGFKKALAGNFDVVLMDIQMPEMDGYTATAKLRGAGYRKPIIALTAHAMSEVRKKCLYVGCSDHLTKPIKIKELVALVARFGHA